MPVDESAMRVTGDGPTGKPDAAQKYTYYNNGPEISKQCYCLFLNGGHRTFVEHFMETIKISKRKTVFCTSLKYVYNGNRLL